MTHRKEILLIDETHALVDACTSMLNGRSEVAREANRTKFDLVVVSIPASIKDELLTLQNVKRRFPGIPLILASDIRSADRIVTALRSGADALVRLPIDPIELFSAICRQVMPSDDNTVPRFTLHLSDDFQALVTGEDEPPDAFEAGNSLLERLCGRYAPARSLRRWGVRISGGHLQHTLGAMRCRPLEGYFLGSFRVMVFGVPVQRWRSRKGKSIFAYLLYHHKRPVFRDLLMETFWPNVDPDCSRDSLNVAIHHIRQDLRAVNRTSEYILFKDECYTINPELEVWLDCEELQSHWHKVQYCKLEENVVGGDQDLKRAVDLYKGDFMEDEPYEDWAASERENYREELLVMLERMSEHHFAQGDIEGSAILCERILEKDTCRENVHKRLMLCYYRLGYRDKAMRQFRKCSEALQRELNMSPTSSTVRLNEDIRQGLISSEKAQVDKI